MDTDSEPTFGGLLRLYRVSAFLTQEDLANRTGLTPQAIGLLERGERRPHAYTVQKLAEALGLEGQDLAEFESAARRQVASRATAEPFRHNLPAILTPLVGREHEVMTVVDLLARDEVRLLTLTGPGGVGKTRLAVEAAGRSREKFVDGVAFVPLSYLRDVAMIPSALARALGIGEKAGRPLVETLKDQLKNRRMLVVLDNFEHLLDAVPLAADLVGACPGLTVLVTSRAPLRLTSECQFPLAPLPATEPASASASVSARPAAMELFCQRARAVAPAFELTDANMVTISEICQRLDGLPLAIELAAARVKLFPPRALLDRLDHRLQVLAGGARDLPERQRTLRDAIAWSYDLLSEDEQVLFRRLSVFAGGCTLEAVEIVCGTEDRALNILETLASLVDNSLLVSGSEASSDPEDEEPRFTMLETIREYAAERLGSDGEVREIQRAHALHYLALAEATQPEAIAQTQQEWWWTRLEEEHDNLRAALRWAVQNREVEIGARFGTMLWRFWATHHPGEGRRWLEAILAMGEPKDEPAHGNTGEAGLPERNRAFLLLVSGMLAARHGDYDHAAAQYEESLALYRHLEHGKGTHGPLRELGAVAYLQGDYERAEESFRESLGLIWRFVGKAFEAVACLEGMARVAAMQGQPDRAARLLGVFAALREEMGTPLSPIVQGDHDFTTNSTREAIGERAFEAAWTAGHATPLDESIADALGDF